MKTCDCGNPEQCWEPCGQLGKSEAHVKVVDDPEFDKALKEAITNNNLNIVVVPHNVFKDRKL